MAKLIKSQGLEEPNVVTVVYNSDKSVSYASININIEKISTGYVWDELVLPEFALDNIQNATYEVKQNVLISHIIKAYYDDNKMAAVINNYLADQEDPDYKSEFLCMQNVRKVAKQVAKHIVSNGLF